MLERIVVEMAQRSPRNEHEKKLKRDHDITFYYNLEDIGFEVTYPSDKILARGDCYGFLDRYLLSLEPSEIERLGQDPKVKKIYPVPIGHLWAYLCLEEDYRRRMEEERKQCKSLIEGKAKTYNVEGLMEVLNQE